MSQKKQFQNWIVKKEELDDRENSLFFKERFIYWIGLGENVGDEENGKGKTFSRPVLVVRKFNQSVFWGVPLSTQLKDNKYYVEITFKGKKQSALITHMRLFDSKRLYSKMGKLDKEEFERVKKEIKDCL